MNLDAILENLTAGRSEEFKMLIENNLYELTLLELIYVSKLPTLEAAKKAILQMKLVANYRKKIILENCKNEENKKELKKAMEYGQKNLLVLELISKSETPYEIRKGFESGSIYTEDNLFGIGFPAFNHLFAENKKVILPDDVLIIFEDGHMEKYSNLKNSKKKCKALM